MEKITPRQNELLSEALCQIAVKLCDAEHAPERIKTIRRALLSEMEAVTLETCFFPDLRVRSTCG